MTTYEREAFTRLSLGADAMPKARLLSAIASLGFSPTDDPRLAPALDKLPSNVSFPMALQLLQSSPLLKRIVLGEISLADWNNLTALLSSAFADACAATADLGTNASYIPPLASVPAALRGASCCTIDGQRFSIGDASYPFTVQSTSKTINYCIALETLGVSKVLSFVDVEPSGTFFNDLVLLPNGTPHNPFINSGAMMTVAHLFRDQPQFARFESILSTWTALCAGTPPGFSNSTFLAERDTADKNFCLLYMMKESKSYPAGNPTLQDDLNLYLSLCSLESTCEQLAIVAATLANWGVNPFTNVRVFSVDTVKSCLSLMVSCGLYDSSATFQASLKIPLPCKSGVSGVILAVVPGKLGLVTFAPPLDKNGNSVFGLDFCRRLNIAPPPRPSLSTHSLHRLLLHAVGLRQLPRAAALLCQGVDVNNCDFDLRTPLHLAAAIGDYPMVRLLCAFGASPIVLDRFGCSPVHEAEPHPDVHSFLLSLESSSPSEHDTSSEHSDHEQYLHNARLLAEASLSLESLDKPQYLPRVVSRGEVFRFFKEEHVIELLPGGDAALVRYALAFEHLNSDLPTLLSSAGLDRLLPLPNQEPDESTSDYLSRAVPPLLLSRLMEGRLAIPDWSRFTSILHKLTTRVKDQPLINSPSAKYSPVLARADPEQLAVCVASVDGQIWGHDALHTSVSLQSCFKPFAFAMALALHGAEQVAKHVGNEPSGKPFNYLGLNSGRPHNALVNAGGLVSCSLMHHAWPQRDRFAFFAERWEKMTGEPASFSQQIFLAEMLASDRNMALAHLLKSAGAFPEEVSDPAQVLKCVEFYSILCSVTCSLDKIALAAACLGNYGVSALTGEQVFEKDVVEKVLSIMLSAGCAEDSGWFEWACGFPCKTGASGLVVGVLPSLGGFAVYSPGLNEFGNSTKGMAFCQELTQSFSLHMFSQTGWRVGEWAMDDKCLILESLFWHCSQGNDVGVKAIWEAGFDLASGDYDGRTALHVAASEGNGDMVRLLVRLCGEARRVRDRRGRLPRDEGLEGDLDEAVLDLL